MRTATSRYQLLAGAGLVLVVVLLAVMVVNILTQLRSLSTADSENMQWTISQLDTEFANLSAVLSKQISDTDRTAQEIALRVDIALSRLSIVNSGRAIDLFEGSTDADQLLARIKDYAERAIAIVDAPGELTAAQTLQLRDLTEEIRPSVRQLAVLGIRISAERSEARRDSFYAQLRWTGGVAIAVMIAMAVLMALLMQMLAHARERDAALRTSSQRLSSTLAASLDAIVAADDDGRITDYNAAAEKLFGWSRDEMLGSRMEETFIPHHMRDAHKAGMARYLSTGEPRVVNSGRIELTALRRSGEEFPIELNITSTVEEDGHTRFISYLRDISERKINEQKLIDARLRAERTDKAKSQFLAVMSHEMRTPLNGILGVLDLLKTTKLTKKQMRYANIAIGSGEILLEHVNEALDITRIETGTLALSAQEFDLGPLIDNIAGVLEPLAQEQGLVLEVEIAPSMRRRFVGDSNRLRQVVTNLVGNAIKFTREGHINIQVSGIHGPQETAMNISVSDTGPGIAPEHQEQIFADFVALDPSKGRQSRGDGLGLSISRKVARQMGGDLTVKSTVGVGSRFTLAVPLVRGDNARTGGEATDLPASAPTEQASRNVLVVEDNNVNRRVLRDMLENMGHDVTEAVHGLAGLERASEQKFDTIFMDISMPGMNGIEATRSLRDRVGPNRDTPIVGLTAHGKEEFREQASLAGMNHFFTKPIRLAVLRNIMAGPLPETNHNLPHSDVLDELIEMLGADRVRETAFKFFKELDAFGELLSLDGHGEPLAEAAHRCKGAASMLGFGPLAESLGHIEAEARQNATKRFGAELPALEKARADAVAHLAVQLP